MIHSVKKTACALTILAISISPALAESIDVKVIGTITPSACKPTLTGGGTIDYGRIPLSSLKRDALTQLDNKQLDFSITCDAPAKVALRPINGRPNTAAGTTEKGNYGGDVPKGISNDNSNSVVGLGLDNGKKIGGYNIATKDVLADGNSVRYIYQNNSGNTWSEHATGKRNNFSPTAGLISSWAKPGTLEPLAFTTLSGKLNVQAYINKISELQPTGEIKLDGLTTLELVYL